MEEVRRLSVSELKEYIINLGIELLNQLDEGSELFNNTGEFLYQLDFNGGF